MQKFVTLFILFSTFAGPKCLFAQGGDHTFVEKGLAIETSGSMDVFNDDYNTKKAVLDKLVAPILEDIRFVDAISSPGNYKSQEHLRAEIIF